mmetsp:Transcript_85177/g.241346  ORF Transcript_85177/g.241346 Transcript_85177/m.241346 type:complete len:529 (+) Transcript_85177:77-1663(+)
MQSLQTSIMRSEGRRRCCFPCNISRCCPCLPTSWTKVQDWLHLVLIVGVVASMLCAIQVIYELGFGESCRSPICIRQWISAVVVLPSTLYFIRTIGSYDEQLQEKKQRHEHEVERLIGTINEQVAEMNELCKKVTENANEFATGRFNDKSQAFKLFLHSIKEHYADLYVGEEMLSQLRRFVVGWFQVFAGTLLNARDNPLLSGAERELNRCATVEQICDAAMQRLEGNTIAFHFQMPADAPSLPHRSIEDGGSFAASARSLAGESRPLCGASWLRCGRFHRYGRERAATATGMPCTLYGGCVKVVLLSRQHVNLLIAFFADLFLVLFELSNDRWSNLTMVVVNEVCITSMLACFEQINEIALLERQIHRYEQRSQEVAKRRDDARDQWERVQQLHDLWLFRTLPSLTILGKIHNKLGFHDMDRRKALSAGRTEEDPRPEFIRHANECLDCLQQKLGPLEDWKNAKEPLAEEWKESIGKQLRDCEGEDIERIMHKLPIINTDFRSLEAPPPSATVRPSPSSSSSGSSRH